MAQVTLQDLTKVFNTSSREVTAVDGMDLEIDHGEFFTFVGPSGCGKTTTLRMIAGLEDPSSGKILYDGEEVTDLAPQERDIAMVFQNVALYPHMSNRENIGYGLKVRGETENYDNRIEEVAELLEISDLLDKKPGQLSGGQQQRVALGRGIIRDPHLILLDEPMSNLDAELKATLRVEIQRLHKEIDTTMIYVTHDQGEAMTMSTQIGVMRGGQLEQVGSPEEIFHSPDSEFVANFIGQPSMNIFKGRISNGGITFGDQNSIELNDEVLSSLRSNKTREELKIGFRPRNVTLTHSDGMFNATVDVIEPIGNEYVIHLVDGKENEIKVVSKDVTSINPGDEMAIEAIDRLYIFDSKTGDTICRVDDSANVEHIKENSKVSR